MTLHLFSVFVIIPRRIIITIPILCDIPLTKRIDLGVVFSNNVIMEQLSPNAWKPCGSRGEGKFRSQCLDRDDCPWGCFQCSYLWLWPGFPIPRAGVFVHVSLWSSLRSGILKEGLHQHEDVYFIRIPKIYSTPWNVCSSFKQKWYISEFILGILTVCLIEKRRKNGVSIQCVIPMRSEILLFFW